MANDNNRRYHTPLYASPEEMEKKIEEYFKSCEGRLYIDEDGKLVLTKSGEPIYLDRRPITIAGLAYHLGMTRQAMLLYRKRNAEFKYILERAKERVQVYYAERLFDREGSNGARFALQNDFDGWDATSKAAEEAATNAIRIINNIPKASEAVDGKEQQ